MTKVLFAKPILEKSKQLLAQKTASLTQQGMTPKMCVILVGNNPASLLYIKNKKKLCEDVGAKFELLHLDENISENEFLKTINSSNQDDSISGLFVQLPVPSHLKHIDISNLIHPNKDVDGFHGNSTIDLYKNTNNSFIPCTPKGILTLLDYYQIQIAGKNIVVIGRSYIVGKPLSLLLSNRDATVTLCHSKTLNLESITKNADIIISAVGKSKYLDEKFINKDLNQVLIDVGMNKDENNKTCGDINFDSVKDLVSAITPVPGGVGPLTVNALVENLILATERILNEKGR